MSFDLERAKKEGCIYVPGMEEEFPARIICSDRFDNLGSHKHPIVALVMCRGHEEVYSFAASGKNPSLGYLKNKPQKLEVWIYEDKIKGEFLACTSTQETRHMMDQRLDLVKTIEVEI